MAITPLPRDEAAGALKPCPICRKPARPELAPFCSKRCADVDLGRWLGGVYAVPADEPGRDGAAGRDMGDD